jgi:hypothetical protein
MARMTVDEKIGQLNLPTSGDITTERNNRRQFYLRKKSSVGKFKSNRC